MNTPVKIQKKWSLVMSLRILFPVIKTALAAGLSWWLATLFEPNFFPYLAPLSAVLITNTTVAESFQKAINRVSGVLGGVLVSLFILHWMPLSALAVFCSVLIGMVCAMALKLNKEIISQIGVSAIMVLAFFNSSGYEWARILETIIGATIGILVNVFVVPQNTVSNAVNKVLQLSKVSSDILHELSFALSKDIQFKKEVPEVRAKLFKYTKACYEAVDLAAKNSRYRFFGCKQHRDVQTLVVAFNRLEHVSLQIRGIARSLADLQDGPSCLIQQNAEFLKIQEAMQATADSVDLFGYYIVDSSKKNIKKLEDCLVKSKKKQEQCSSFFTNDGCFNTFLEMGSLLNNLSRIIKEISIAIK